MPQEYTVKSWNAWMNDEGLIRDGFGNYKGTVLFEEDSVEPIDATFKTQPNPGDKKYGIVSDYVTKAGKTRKGFKAAQKPLPQTPAHEYTPTTKKEWQPRDDDRIVAQWSISQSIALLQSEIAKSGSAKDTETMIESWAKKLFAMVDRVKTREAEIAKSELESLAQTAVIEDISDDAIDLSDIPF
jgi:hypothetical protein